MISIEMMEHTIGYQIWVMECFMSLKSVSYFILMSSLLMLFGIFFGILEGIKLKVSFIKFFSLTTILSLLLLCIIPEKDTLFLMVQDSVNKEIKEGKIPKESLGILNRKLSKYWGIEND